MTSADELLNQAIASKREQRAIEVAQRQDREAAQVAPATVLGWDQANQGYLVQDRGGTRLVQSHSTGAVPVGAEVLAGRGYLDAMPHTPQERPQPQPVRREPPENWAILYSVEEGENQEFWVRTAASDTKVLEVGPVYEYRLEVSTNRPSIGIIGYSEARLRVTDSLGRVLYQRVVSENWNFDNTLSGGSSEVFVFASSSVISFEMSTFTSISDSILDSGGLPSPANIGPFARVEVKSTSGGAYITQGFTQRFIFFDSGTGPVSGGDTESNTELPYLDGNGFLYEKQEDGSFVVVSGFTPSKTFQILESWVSIFKRQIFVLAKGISVYYAVGTGAGAFDSTEYPAPGNVETDPNDWRAPLANVEFYEGGNGACIDQFIQESDVNLKRLTTYRIDLDQLIDGQTLRDLLQTTTATITAALEIYGLSESESDNSCIVGESKQKKIKLKGIGRAATIEGIVAYG